MARPRKPRPAPEDVAEDMPSTDDEVNKDTRSPLGIYLRINGISTATFAKAMGAPWRSVQQWAKGAVVPHLAYCYEIERITKGVVPMEAWLGIPTCKEYIAKIRAYQPESIRKMPTTVEVKGKNNGSH